MWVISFREASAELSEPEVVGVPRGAMFPPPSRIEHLCDEYRSIRQ